MIDKNFILNSLGNIYSDLIEKENYEESIKKLNAININQLINILLYSMKIYNDDDKNIIELIILILQNIYNNSGLLSPVSDEEYDKLYELNKDLNNKEIVGSIFNTKNKIIDHHNYPDLRGTINKIHFLAKSEKGIDKRKSLEEWIESIERILNRKLLKHEKKLILTPKWDGVSIIFECENDISKKALTRGHVIKNEAMVLPFLTHNEVNFSYVNDKKYKKYGVKTEIIMTGENYERFKKKYGDFKSPRSAVSSIINSNENNKDYLNYLTIIPLQVQDYLTKEIIIPNYIFDKYGILVENYNYELLNKLFYKIKEKMYNETVPIDGIVLRIADPNIQNIVGRENNINKYEAAFKFPAEEKKTKLINVEMCVGSLGAITPRAEVTPVKIKGNTITHISLGSIDRFESLNLRKGDEVIVKYEIIPYLIKNNSCKQGDGEIFLTPVYCPYCNYQLKKDPVLKCVNDNCDSRKIGKIINYIEKIKISNISEAIVTIFYKLGILTKIEDLYNLGDNKTKILELNGFGAKKLKNILDGIKSRSNIYDYELLGALGISGIGEKIFKKILDVYSLKELQNIANKNKTEKLTSIQGIKNKTAKKIINGLNDNIDTIKFLCSRLNIKHDNRKYNIKVCFTKVRDKEFEKFLDSKQVLVLDNYNKNVDIIITLDKNSESGKIEKAKKDGKKILSINEAYTIFGFKK